jgi:hypothetical protein
VTDEEKRSEVQRILDAAEEAAVKLTPEEFMRRWAEPFAARVEAVLPAGSRVFVEWNESCGYSKARVLAVNAARTRHAWTYVAEGVTTAEGILDHVARALNRHLQEGGRN